MRQSAPSPLLRRTALATLSLALGACAPTAALDAAAGAAPAAAPAAAAERPPLATWPGVYALVGSNFPDGTRAAQLEIARVDTTYRVAVHGPPGELVDFRLVADSAYVLWDLGSDGAVMAVDLRLAGDSVTGRWQIGDAQGSIAGRRVR